MRNIGVATATPQLPTQVPHYCSPWSCQQPHNTGLRSQTGVSWPMVTGSSCTFTVRCHCSECLSRQILSLQCLKLWPAFGHILFWGHILKARPSRTFQPRQKLPDQQTLFIEGQDTTSTHSLCSDFLARRIPSLPHMALIRPSTYLSLATAAKSK